MNLLKVCDWELSTYVADWEINRYDGILNSTLALLRIATAYDNIFKNKISKPDLKEELEYFGVDVLGEIDDFFYNENIDFSFVLDFYPQ